VLTIINKTNKLTDIHVETSSTWRRIIQRLTIISTVYLKLLTCPD